jgi:Indole-3-glycerol phosphate synthase
LARVAAPGVTHTALRDPATDVVDAPPTRLAAAGRLRVLSSITAVTGPRRLSQAISEGDGISVLVEVRDGESARAAEAQGAEGIVLRAAAVGVREATQLPILLYGVEAQAPDADAFVVDVWTESPSLETVVDGASELGLECVVKVRDEGDLERALERVDPEILLLSVEEADSEHALLERLLDLLPDIPAGKLAIAELESASRDDVEELERAGVDAVLVTGSDIGALVGEQPPEV